MESLTATTVADVDVTSGMTQPTTEPFNAKGQLGGVVISLMIVFGAVGNVLVLTAVIQHPQLHRSCNAFIASLSVTDLIYSVAVMPFYADAYIHPVPEMTYNMSGGTLNPTHSLTLTFIVAGASRRPCVAGTHSSVRRSSCRRRFTSP